MKYVIFNKCTSLYIWNWRSDSWIHKYRHFIRICRMSPIDFEETDFKVTKHHVFFPLFCTFYELWMELKTWAISNSRQFLARTNFKTKLAERHRMIIWRDKYVGVAEVMKFGILCNSSFGPIKKSRMRKESWDRYR